jgi:O-antigen/teichoic acid export membrane protein
MSGAERVSALRRLVPSIRNVVAGYAGTAGEAFVFLLLTPFLVRKLGLEDYGLWGVGVGLADWVQVLDPGLREALMKYVSAHQARAEGHLVRRLADTALQIYLGVAALGILGLGAACLFVLPTVVDDPARLVQLRWVVVLLGLSSILSLPAGMAASILEGLGRFDLMNGIRVVHAGTRLVLSVAAVQFGFGLPGVAAAELLGRVLLHVLRWRAVASIDPTIVPRPRLHPGQVRQLLDFGVWSWLRQASELVVMRAYEPILSFFTGLSATGAFFAGRRLASVGAEAIVPLASVLFPLSSELDAQRRERALKQTLLQTSKIAFLVGLPLSLVLALGADAIQTNWLGNRAPGAAEVMQAFALVFLPIAVALPAESILLGLGYARLLAWTAFLQGAITIGLGVALLPWLGSIGLAYGALVGAAVVQAGIHLPLASLRCGVPIPQLIRRVLLPPSAAGAPVGYLLLLTHDHMALGGLAALGSWAGGGIVIYSLLLWWFGFDEEEKAFLRRHFGRLMNPAV